MHILAHFSVCPTATKAETAVMSRALPRVLPPCTLSTLAGVKTQVFKGDHSMDTNLKGNLKIQSTK